MIDMRQTLLDAARPMVQARGYNALSFRDLAEKVGIKSSSVHYHFPTKGDLGAALARQYTDEGAAYLETLLSDSLDIGACITRYAAIFRAALERDNRMCLCGIMAAEHDDLPAQVRTEVDRFTTVNLQWLARLLSLRKSKARQGLLEKQALAIYAAIQGAQLVARGRGDIAVFDESIAAYRAAGLLP
jgi:TetR/AcrR family transcriptional repressor of nem operon